MSNFTTTPDTNSDKALKNLDDDDDDDDDVAKLVRNFDWASTPLGPMDSWPRWLKFLTVSNKSELIIVDQLEKGDKRSLYSINVQDFCLNTTFPMVLFVGEDRIHIYNQSKYVN